MLNGSMVKSYYLSHNPVIGLLGPYGCVASIAFIVAIIALRRTRKTRKPSPAIVGIVSSLVSLVTVLIWRFGWIASTNGEFFYAETFTVTLIATIVIAALDLIFIIICAVQGNIRSVTRDELSSLCLYVVIILCLVSPFFLGLKSVIVALLCIAPAYFFFAKEAEKKNRDGKQEEKPTGEKVLAAIILVSLCFCIGMGVRFVATGGLSGGISNPNGSRTCSVCRKSYKAGDSGGNYMSIARSGMCVSCNSSFHGAKDALEQQGIYLR